MSIDRPQAVPGLLADAGWRFYAITTKDRPDRQRRLRDEFARAGIPVDVLVGERPTDSNGFASTGVWGCFSAHLTCLRKARDEGATVAVMAEDDVVITKAFQRQISRIVEQLAGLDWAMVHLGYLPESPAVRTGLELVSANVGRLEGWEVRGTHLYAVHTRALDALIDDFASRLVPGGHRISADGVLNEFRRDNALVTLVTVPNLAHQAPSPSGITEGDGRVHALKTRVLRDARAQRTVESVKRLGWDALSALPPSVHTRAWNLRARARSGTARPASGGC